LTNGAADPMIVSQPPVATELRLANPAATEYVTIHSRQEAVSAINLGSLDTPLLMQ